MLGILHQGRQRHPQAEYFGIVQVAGKTRRINHPSVRVALVEAEVPPCGHHPDAAGGGDAVVQPGQIERAQSAAGEPAAPDMTGIDILA